MAFEFHGQVDVMLQQQYLTTKNYIIPFVQKYCSIGAGTRVMDIGCGYGGVLSAFAEKGCEGLGVDLNPYSISQAFKFQAKYVESGKLNFENIDIYKFTKDPEPFDLIVFKDSIEHIPDQARIISYVKKFLKPNGKVFFGFPPWLMPFGGHQQLAKHKLFSKLPYYHLLPKGIYVALLKAIGENQKVLDDLVEIKDLGIHTHQFEKYAKQGGYNILKRQLFFINPIYAYKFGINPLKQIGLLSQIPYLRDFLSTAVYYLIQPKS